MKSRVTIISGMVALVSFAALLAGLFWMPSLLRSAQLDEARLSSIEQVISIVGGITGILSTLVGAISAILGRTKSAGEPVALLKELLRPVTPDELIVKYGGANAGRFNWIDRGAVTSSMLYEHRRIAILGRMKIGKTREAAELIRRVLAEGGVPESQVFDLTTVLKNFDPDRVRQALPMHLDGSLPKIFYINDLPQQYKGKNLETLATALNTLKSCGCCFIIFTARLDQMTPAHKVWVRDAGFYTVDLRPLDPGEVRWLSYSAAAELGLQLDELALQEFVKYADGTPARTIMALSRLQGAAYQQVGKVEASRYASLSLQDSWKEIRKEVMENTPDAKYLFQALALLFRARITAYRDLTLRLAYLLKLREQKSSLARPLRLSSALDNLRHYDIYLRDQVFQFPDVAVEDVIIDEKVSSYRDILSILGDTLSHPPPMLAKIFYPVPAKELGECFFSLAYNYYALHQLEVSERYYRIALSHHSGDARMHYKFGNVLGELDKEDESAVEYRRALELDPNYVQAHNNLAVYLEGTGRREEAIAEYKRAVEISPSYVFANNALWRLLKDPSYRDRAIAGYRQAVEPEPSYEAPHHNKLGNVLRGLELHEEAVTEYKRALELDPNYAEAHCNLGLALAAAGKYEEAEARLRTALKLAPNFTEAYIKLADLLRKLGHSEEAVRMLRNAVASKPGDKNLCYHLAIVLYRSGQVEDAVSELRQLVQQHPDYMAAHFSLGYVMEEQGQYDQAEAEYKFVLEKDPENVDAHDGLGHLLTKLGRYEQAAEEYRCTLEGDPDYPKTHYNLGLILAHLGQNEQAVIELRKAMDAEPDDPDICYRLAVVLAQSGELEDALVELRELLETQPDYAAAHYSLAYLLEYQGHNDMAADEYRQALELDPKQANVHYRLGYLLANMGQREQAVEEYRRVLEINPGYPEAHYSLGLVLQDLGQLEPAVEQFDLAIQFDPENGFRYTSKAHALRDLGRDQEADELLVQARQRVPENDCYNRACLEAVAGNFDPALQYLEMAIRENSSQRQLAARDPDLADLRGNPRFQALVRGE